MEGLAETSFAVRTKTYAKHIHTDITIISHNAD
jgi:hypothetical protein